MCSNGLDDDGDGDVDCVDSDCAGNVACANPEDCTNGTDDNGDGDVDCDDVLCAGIHPSCGEVCGDGIDNDGDGDVDCNDTDCTNFSACQGNPMGVGDICAYQGDPPHTCECADGIDNDGDGNIDSADIHCFGPLDDNEAEFATGIPGDNNGANAATECPFDGNSGTGNDKDACCNADASMNATPNGCDSLGCCEVDINGNGTGEHVGIYGLCDFAPACGSGVGTEGCACANDGECDTDQSCVMDNDIGPGYCTFCNRCIANNCENPCSCGETCFGGFVQTEGCGVQPPPSDAGTPGADSGVPPPPMCPGGEPLCPNGDADCTGANETCINGCCFQTCPSGVPACTFTSDCPMTNQSCVTGCCIIIG
jgi:hypothetical protein